MDIRMEGRLVYDVPPFSTDMGELAPSELEIPAFFII
jgi:hypothetical protein